MRVVCVYSGLIEQTRGLVRTLESLSCSYLSHRLHFVPFSFFLFSSFLFFLSQQEPLKVKRSYRLLRQRPHRLILRCLPLRVNRA